MLWLCHDSVAETTTTTTTTPAAVARNRNGIVKIVKLEHVICVGRVCLCPICQKSELERAENDANAGKCKAVNIVLKNGLSSYSIR